MNFNFVLKETSVEKVTFTFNPKDSTCHSFNDNPPKSWNEVYKVYYYYDITKEFKWDKKDTWGDKEQLFNSCCDECSVIKHVSDICLNKELYFDHKKSEELYPFGDGVSWEIKRIPKNKTLLGKKDYYVFCLWRYDGVGYRFEIDQDKVEEFGKFLNDCCEYMLKHGVGI